MRKRRREERREGRGDSERQDRSQCKGKDKCNEGGRYTRVVNTVLSLCNRVGEGVR